MIIPDIFRYKVFEESLKYFDFNHKETKEILLSVNEEDQQQVLMGMTTKLYNNIVEKADDVDFGTVPNSKGDITKIDRFEDLNGAIKNIRDILVHYKQNTKACDTVIKAMENMKANTPSFTKGYMYDIEMVMVMYNSLALACVASTSLLIASCVDFIKSPHSETIEAVIDKTALTKTSMHLLFKNLEKFNDNVASGDFNKLMTFLIGNKVKNLMSSIQNNAGTVAATIAAIAVTLAILPMLRELIYFYYHTRTRVSEYFDLQADLLAMNADNVNRTNKSPEEKKRILARQAKVADKFRTIARKLEVTAKTAEVEVTKDVVRDNSQKYKITDVSDVRPDSVEANAQSTQSSVF